MKLFVDWLAATTAAVTLGIVASGSSDQVHVRFHSDDHESRLNAFWDNGPRSEVEERDD
jgi:hypothetical protein